LFIPFSAFGREKDRNKKEEKDNNNNHFILAKINRKYNSITKINSNRKMK